MAIFSESKAKKKLNIKNRNRKMKAPDFSYEKPTSISDVLILLENNDLDCQLLAGGQSLMPMMNFRMANPGTLVDISAVSELAGINELSETIEIGAMVSYRELEHSKIIKAFCPLVTMVLPYVAHAAIRNRGTIGGSVGLSDPAAELPAVLLALNGEIEITSRKGKRSVPAKKFFKGIYETECRADELITKIILPKAHQKQNFGFDEVARRHGDYAMAGVCIAQDIDLMTRVAFFGVSDKAVRAFGAEKLLSGHSSFSEEVIRDAQNALNELEFEGDMNAGPEAKQHIAKVVLERALKGMKQ